MKCFTMLLKKVLIEQNNIFNLIIVRTSKLGILFKAANKFEKS